MGTEKQFSKQVFEQIAQDLVKEQAELLKHQTLVEEYKKILVEGKKEIIRKLVKGKRLYFDGKPVIVLEVQFDVEDNKLGVTVIVGLDPFKEKIPSSLTKSEKRLLEQYKVQFRFHEPGEDRFLEPTWEGINKLSCLKNHFDLARCYYWTLDMNDAIQPDFFSRSGLNSGVYGGPSCKELMIEEVTRNNR